MQTLDLDRLRPRWSAEAVFECGRPIFEAVPAREVPEWAGSILRYLADDRLRCQELALLVDISQSKSDADWQKAHDVFKAIRQLRLHNGKQGLGDTVAQMILDVGETTAKVIYNAAGGPAPFDPHAGWRFAPQVKRALDNINSPQIEDNCWLMLTRQ